MNLIEQAAKANSFLNGEDKTETVSDEYLKGRQAFSDGFALRSDRLNTPFAQGWFDAQESYDIMSQEVITKVKQHSKDLPHDNFTPSDTEGTLEVELADGKTVLKVSDVVYMVNFGFFATTPLCEPYFFLEAIEVSGMRPKFNIVSFERIGTVKDAEKGECIGSEKGFEYSKLAEPSYSLQKGHAYYQGIFKDWQKAKEFAAKFARRCKKAYNIS